MVTPQSPHGTVKEQAIYWVTRIHSGEYSETERPAFEAWLASDKAHQREYEQAEEFWRGIERVDSSGLPEMRAARAFRPVRVVLRRTGLMAAAAVLVVLGIGIWTMTPREATYRTARGEQKTVTLSDGSRIAINTDTELSVTLDRHRRTVALHHGEALFTVTHNSDPRPFEVLAGNGRIRDLGTEFTVDRRPEGTLLTVVEGSVEITTKGTPATRVSAGERVTYSTTGDLSAVERVDVDAATAWRNGRLVFKDMVLGEVVRQISRYHDVKMVITDLGVSQLRVSGTFKIDDVNGLLAAVEMTLPVKSRKLNDAIWLDRADH